MLMRQFYRNTILVIAIFLLAVLMQYLREGGLYLPEMLALSSWYAIGLTGAVLVGRAMVVSSR
jgi:hypothetical protein